MKKLMITIFVLFLCVTTVRADEVSDPIYQEAEGYGISSGLTLEENVSRIWADVCGDFDDLMKGGARIGVQILAVVLLCGMVEVGGLGKNGRFSAVSIAGALAVCVLSMGEVSGMIGLGRETIHGMRTFSQILLPVMATLTAATGNIRLAALHQGATVLFAEALITVIDVILMPMVYVYIATCCGDAAVENEGLRRIATLIKRGIGGALTGMLLLFVGYLTISGAIAGSADGATVRAAKIAMNRAVPVVGGILSDAAETMLVGAGVLRTSVGVVGLLVVVAICLVPFLHLFIHYLTFQLAGALAATVAEKRLSQLIEQIGSAFGLVLGMAGTCALLLMFSLVSAVVAVVPS